MFREEAGALIALPQHPNLARFVTFDAGTKPKPILVMELVEGMTLERLLETRGLDMPRALRILDDVLAGSRRCTRSASGTSISSRRTSSCGAARRPCSSTSGSRAGTSVRGAPPGRTARPRCGALRRPGGAVGRVARESGHLRVRVRRLRDAHRARALRRGDGDGADLASRRARRLPAAAPHARQIGRRSGLARAALLDAAAQTRRSADRRGRA